MAVERIYYDKIKELEEQFLVFKNLRKMDTESLISKIAENKQLKDELIQRNEALIQRNDQLIKRNEEYIQIKQQINLIKKCHDISEITEILCDGCKKTLSNIGKGIEKR